jgi:hypothetical protein
MIALIGAITALLTAIVALFALLNQIGFLEKGEPKEKPRKKKRAPEPKLYDHQWDDDD